MHHNINFNLWGQRLKILFICTKYPEVTTDSYLTSDLADAMAEQGHDVSVISLQWESRKNLEVGSLIFPSGVEAHYFKPGNLVRAGRIFERLTRWGLSSFFARAKVNKALGGKKFDLVVVFAPLSPLAAIVISQLRTAKFALTYVTDFFPYAHRDLGLIPRGPIFSFALWLESHLLRKFDAITCMSEGNVAFLKKHYKIDEKTIVSFRHLWGPSTALPSVNKDTIRSKYDLPVDRKIIVFGGQLTEGRGIEEVIAAAEILGRNNEAPVFLLVGSGRLYHLVEAALNKGTPGLYYIPTMPRADYLELASACDCGLVVTIANTNVPTFPSKTIDYARCGLPVLASLEASTDFGDFVESRGFGKAILAGEPARLADAAVEFFADKRQFDRMRESAALVVKSEFSVQEASKSILQQAMGALSLEASS